MNPYKWSIAAACLCLLLNLSHSASSKEPTPKNVSFAGDTVGGEPKAFAPVVGHWLINQDDGNNVLTVDGSKWKEGQASAGIADKARALYGERYAEFLDNVKKYAYFPLAVYKETDNFSNGEVTVRFKPMSGRIDQAGGIVFNLKPNGDYLVLRGNALENNLVLFKYVHGKRSPVKWVRNTPTATRQWHDLKLAVKGTAVKGYLDGKLYLEETLKEPVTGKIGLWSKADSVVHFADFTVKSEQP